MTAAALVAVAAVVDQPDLGVQSFEFAAGQSELDGGQDLLAPFAHGANQVRQCATHSACVATPISAAMCTPPNAGDLPRTPARTTLQLQLQLKLQHA